MLNKINNFYLFRKKHFIAHILVFGSAKNVFLVKKDHCPGWWLKSLT